MTYLLYQINLSKMFDYLISKIYLLIYHKNLDLKIKLSLKKFLFKYYN